LRLLLIFLSAVLLLAGCSHEEMSVDPVYVRASSSSSVSDEGSEEPELEPRTREMSGVSLTAEYPVYSPDIQRISFLLENNSDTDLTYGLDYCLEYNNQGNWEPVPPVYDAVAAIGLVVQAGTSRAVTINTSSYRWDWREGLYHWVQPVSLGSGSQKLYAEFSIGESSISGDTPYGFMRLEDIPNPYPREQSDADGVIYNFHGKIQSNEDKILEFFQKIDCGLPSMIRIVSITMEGDPVYADIEYIPEKGAFLCRFDSTRDKFGSENQITSDRYPFLQIQETESGLGIVLSEWRKPEDGTEGSTIYLPFFLSPEKKEEFLRANRKLQKKYNLDNVIQCTFSPSGDSWASIVDAENIAVQLPGNGYMVPAGGKDLYYLEWQDETILKVWDRNSQYWVYDTGKQTFTEQIAVCGLPLAPEN